MSQSEGRHYHFQQFEFWAERGMISLVDTKAAANRESEYHWRIAPGEFMKRAIAAYMKEPPKYPSELAALRGLLDNAKAACKLAKAQGDPTDPSVLEHVIRHQRRRSALVLPHELPPMPGTPRLKIKAHGQTAADTLRDGVSVVPDLTIGPEHMLTPQRAARLRSTGGKR